VKLFVHKETPGESRVAVVPETIRKLRQLGASVVVESGLAASIAVRDSEYEDAGAEVTADKVGCLRSADIVLRLRPPALDEVALMRKGCIHISHLDPFQNPEILKRLADARVSAICMEMIPRTTIAQKMDSLSSQASLAGYAAVIIAAERLNRIFPMMMTASGTIAPARVFIIGAGVAGLQAIATARRLGARVEAFDTRPGVAEQVQSLGARFVRVDLGDTGQTKDGYALELTPGQLELQRQAMAKHSAMADVVITTAQVFGRPAPRILTRTMVEGMKPGSIVVDMAVETGGNVEGSELNREIDIGGVRVIGIGNLPGRVAAHASLMYSNNLGNLIEHFWDAGAHVLKLDTKDEIMDACLVVHEGVIRNENLRALVERREKKR